MRKHLKIYLRIKNAIISLLLTVMYFSWLIEGLHPVKIIVACISVFVIMMNLLGMADDCYIRANKKSAPVGKP